ncbi:MAG: fructose-6-phosphate aldolase [Bdellovibrionales bacterium]|nr:fructose-6-phosphate aldolase [Bdellovibrionales bacterium]
MKFFIDTADIHQIKEINQWFPLDGVTTNPTLVAQVEQEHHHLIRSISEVVKGPVSAEVLSTSSEEMLKEARELAGLHSQVVVKLPLTQQGLITTRILSKENIPTNLTLCFSALQALAAARAGATFVSIFVGRLDDIGIDGMEIVSQVIHIFSHYQVDTKVLVASVRHVSHLLAAAELGADMVTIPPALFSQMIQHPLTDKGLTQFLKSAGRL